MVAPTQLSSVSPSLADFAQHGYGVEREVFSLHEVKAWRKEVERLLRLDIINPHNLRSPFKHPEAPFPQRIEPVLGISRHFRDLVDDERVQRILHTLFAEKTAILRKDLHFHPPGAHQLPWLQDYAQGWDILPEAEAITLSFPLEPMDRSYGYLEVYDGAHTQLLTQREAPAPLGEKELESLGDDKKREVEALPGDIVALHCLAPHRNGDNATTYPRRSLNITFFPARFGDLRSNYYAHYIARQQDIHPSRQFL